MPGFYEFFAGGGMAREGLGPQWRCLFANDVDAGKSAAYRANWGDGELKTADVAALRSTDLPDVRANLAWASFPCQDLSLAGVGAGLKGARSGTFFSFWSLIEQLIEEDRAPDLIVLENVRGALTSRGGADFAALCARLDAGGYAFGALIMDAALFLPQSRPRVFVVGVRRGLDIAPQLAAPGATLWHPPAVCNAYAALPLALRRAWIWWTMPSPAAHAATLSDLIEDDAAVAWQAESETLRLLALMNEKNQRKIEAARTAGRRVVGCVYRRTRSDPAGGRRQRAEARFDGLAGCLRTPAGGSSRQVILVIDGERVRSRLISARETARLMGLPDAYRLPSNYNAAYHLTGDGVVVPVVRHLARHLLEPILARQAAAAA
ncbi:DNA cytosine methyltransferase [Methylocella tundrae]|uniref:DNA (cytosine-5-)-methyltransferase n=1 Tax=Methylocella tundrae TaxID=227605 RepID=A0A4U8YW15_METTU|nr:DNA cytosine methyltransferase [Methylocella tundrae]WPP05585.1 DNA cytosine methyltransferase [Methylocella tundrae]VFU08031.1 DNA (Cytosine-5-)-methyltransferase [Methylocella tundrae]